MACADIYSRPLIFLHGTPSCRLECAEFHKELFERNIRLIAPDRPGFGRSEFLPGRTIGNYAEDIRALAKHLNLDRYALVGGSGGGPYALACARYIHPDEGLSAIGVLAGAGPWECSLKDVNWNTKLTLYLAKYTPGLMKWLSKFSLPLPKYPPTGPLEELKADPEAEASVEKKLDAYVDTLKGRDLEAMQKPETKQCLAATLVESVIQGVEGYAYEAGLYTKPWDFHLEDIKYASGDKAKKLLFIYGTDDANTTLHMGRYMCERVAGSELREEKGETHFTIGIKAVDHFDEVLKLGGL